MSKNTRIPNPEKNLPPAHEMVIEMLRTFRGYTTKSKCTCTGQCTIERGENTLPLVVMYASYPNGDYLCWFNDNTGFTMYSLVNEKFKHIMSCKPEELPLMIAEANKLKDNLGK
jgi:hypothetical protein